MTEFLRKEIPTRTVIDLVLIGVAVTVLTVIHYKNYHYSVDYHLVLQFGYYIPVIYAAMRFGPLGGIACGLIITALFLPFIMHYQTFNSEAKFTQWIEIVLINGFGWLTGFLIEQERKARNKYKKVLRIQKQLVQKLKKEAKERSRLEAEVRQAERLTALGQLSAGLAHEIRNPLGIIKVTAQLLAQERPDDKAIAEHCHVLQEESSRLNRLVSDFLSFARPKEPMRHRLPLVEVLEAGIDLVGPLMYQQGITLEKKLGKISLVYVEVDPDQMKQVILNLLLNAIEAQVEGGRIIIEGIQDKDFIGFAVCDEGPGIPDDVLPYIFNPFFTTKDKGTGLGLSVVHRILEQHGGRISLTNLPERGTRAVVLLPR